MSKNNYPKRFEILQNDGKSLKFRVNELTKWVDECFVKHFINDKDQGEAREIEEIDNALSQIKKGTYGVCESCGRKINKQRLMAIPFVSLCIKCKEAEERDEGFMINRMELS